MNYEWLSGSVLYQALFLIPERFNWLACTYVVVMETLLIWGLLARRPALVWATLAQLGLFHAQSLTQIHWFYPSLMATILSWFVIERVVVQMPVVSSGRELVRLKAPMAIYLLLTVFAAFQLSPLLYGKDRALTGQGRLLALHMFEARQQCEVEAVLHRTDAPPETLDLKMYGLPPRTICDTVGLLQPCREPLPVATY